MTIEADDFLEHFGVRGMRWGVRRNNDAQESQSFASKHKKGIAAGALAVGALGVGVILKRSGSTSLSSLHTVNTRDFSMVTRDPSMARIVQEAITSVNMAQKLSGL